MIQKIVLSMLFYTAVIIAGAQSTKTLHDFKVTDIDGTVFDFAQLKGKKVMIVNTASKCGYTSQYKDLEALYLQYKDSGFIIIGFPANNFLKQEPGTDEEIKSFCSLQYNVTFPMMSKISVKGNDIAPIYEWLQNKTQNGIEDANVSWNFNKYLIDENGKWVKHFGSNTPPLSDEIKAWINSK